MAVFRLSSCSDSSDASDNWQASLVDLEMRRIPVRSTSIASIGYLAAERELEIEFRASGDVYRYFDVPEGEYAALLAADSKGTYFNRVFKERNHRYRLVSRGT
jgi:hypothetical protein